MSSNLALARPLRGRPVESERAEERAPHLEIAATRAQRRARPKLVYALVVVGGIGVILLAQLLLSIVVADGAYRISALQLQQRDYSRQQQALGEKLDVLGSTQNVASKAEALGMVTSGSPSFLNATTGAVTGSATAAGGSLIGSQGNLVGNSLLAGDAIDAAAQQALEQQAAAQQVSGQSGATEDGGIATATGDTGSGTTGSGTTSGGTTSGTTGGTGSAGTGASAGSTGGGSVPSAPGVIPSPTTH